MDGYDYGNARLRALKSRLLSRGEMESLAQVGTMQALISSLLRTAYQKAIEAALVRASGLECVTWALGSNMVETLGRVRSFYSGREGELVAILLQAYDVHNLTTILNGLAKQATADEIVGALVPVGDLSLATLSDLARASEPREAIDLLATMRAPIARPLLKLRAENPGAGSFSMGLALHRWYFDQSLPQAKGVLSSALEIEADLINLMTMFRFASAPFERQVLARRMGSDALEQMLVGPGRLSFRLLKNVGQQDSLKDAVGILAETPYHGPLSAALDHYQRSGRLSDVEKALRRFRLHWMARLIIQDPLGIGVVLGYVALKISEISNLRWIAQGINLGLEVDTIRAELEFSA